MFCKLETKVPSWSHKFLRRLRAYVFKVLRISRASCPFHLGYWSPLDRYLKFLKVLKIGFSQDKPVLNGQSSCKIIAKAKTAEVIMLQKLMEPIWRMKALEVIMFESNYRAHNQCFFVWWIFATWWIYFSENEKKTWKHCDF
jgi:hypothetical protein